MRYSQDGSRNLNKPATWLVEVYPTKPEKNWKRLTASGHLCCQLLLGIFWTVSCCELLRWSFFQLPTVCGNGPGPGGVHCHSRFMYKNVYASTGGTEHNGDYHTNSWLLHRRRDVPLIKKVCRGISFPENWATGTNTTLIYPALVFCKKKAHYVPI